MLKAPGLAAVMSTYRDALRTHQAVINRLNVFPVPDGDTGTNMLLTAEAVVSEVDDRTRSFSSDGEVPMAVVCEAISHGSLMGARGNSGVILCQVLRGIATTFSPLEQANGADVATALDIGSKSAREAVLKPAEGTILTVAAMAASAALGAVDGSHDLVEVLDAAREAAVAALWATPDQLAVLFEAGVVDAGGAGLVLLYDAMLHVVDARPLPDELELPEEVARVVATGAPIAVTPVPGMTGRNGETSPRYEVMYFLSADEALIPAFKDVWAGIGDSIVVVGGDGLWNCHIHTDDVGAAIEAGIDAGTPRDIRVTDLADQVEEERWVREGASAPNGSAPTPGKTPATAIVAVANGEGIERIFHSLGAQHLVHGGQSMNPSTRDILDVVESLPSDEVVILPNNANIIPVARQAADVSRKKVRVVPTEGFQEGFAALLEYDPEASAEENEAAMSVATRRIVAGEVTSAVRATTSRAGRVDVGDYIGLSRNGIESVDKGLAEATIGLLKVLLRPGHEIVTLLQGEGATPAATRHDHRVGVRRASRTHRRAPSRRTAPLSVSAFDRMSEASGGRRLGQLDRTPVEVLRGVGTRKRAALRAMGIESVLDLLTHYPRRWADRTKAVADDELVAGDVGRRLGDSATRQAPPNERKALARRGRRRRRDRRARRHLLQPAVAGKAAPRGSRGGALWEGRRFSLDPSNGEPGRRGHRFAARHARWGGSCRSTRSLSGRESPRASSPGYHRRGARPGGRVRRSVPEGLRKQARPRRSHGGLFAVSTDPSRWRRRMTARAPTRLRRAVAHPGGARDAKARLVGECRGASPTMYKADRAPGSSIASLTDFPSTLTTAQARVIDEIRRDLAAPVADAPPLARRRRLGQDGRRSGGAACSACKVAIKAPSWCRPRSSPSSTSSRPVSCSAISAGGGRAASSVASDRSRSLSSRAGRRVRLGRDRRRAPLRARSTSSSARTRSSPRTSASPRSASSSSTNSTASASTNAPPCGRRARPRRRRSRSRPARDDGDADPAHGGDDRLRRSRSERAR